MGHCVQEKAEEVFAKYDKEHKGGLYYRDILTMINGNRNVGLFRKSASHKDAEPGTEQYCIFYDTS